MKFLPVAALAMMLVIAGCDKKNSTSTLSDAAKFQGTWACTSSCNPSSTTNLVLSLGYDVNTLITTGTSVGTGSCVFPVTLTMTASGNTLSIPAQTFTDNCGKQYSVSGSGTIDSVTNTMLSIKENIVLGTTTTSCTFTGHK